MHAALCARLDRQPQIRRALRHRLHVGVHGVAQRLTQRLRIQAALQRDLAPLRRQLRTDGIGVLKERDGLHAAHGALRQKLHGKAQLLLRLGSVRLKLRARHRHGDLRLAVVIFARQLTVLRKRHDLADGLHPPLRRFVERVDAERALKNGFAADHAALIDLRCGVKAAELPQRRARGQHDLITDGK